MTKGVATIIALLCICVLGYEFIIGGLPKVVLLCAGLGLLSSFIRFYKAWKHK